MTPKISVIVPVYNVEKYLQRCVNSLISQTYSNIEIILVDDGSPDGSPAICDEYAQTESRIKVVHKKNGGLSSARNAGIEIASGDYLTFVDSDDWIARDTIQYSFDKIKEYSADVVQNEFKMVYSQEEAIENPSETVDVFEGKEILQHYLRQSTIDGSYSVCRCLFPSAAIKTVRFREGKINEDIDFKYRVLSNCKKMVVTNQIKYFYFQQGSSLSTGGLKKRDFDLYDAANALMDLAKNEQYGKIKFYAEVKQARTPFSLLCKIAYFGIQDKAIDKKDIIRKLTAEHRFSYKVLLKAPLSLSRKVLVVCFAINYNVTEILVHLLKPVFKY